MDTGQVIRAARLAAGASESDLARRVKTTASAIAAYEKGSRTPTLPMLRRLLDACEHDLTFIALPRDDGVEQPDASQELLLEAAAANGLPRSAMADRRPSELREAAPMRTTPSTLGTRLPVEVTTYEPRHEDDVIALLVRAFGSWPLSMEETERRRCFRWLMYERPGGDSRSSLVALHEGRVVGFLAQLSWTLLLDGCPVQSIRQAELALDPGHRLSGVSFELKRAALEAAPSGTLSWSSVGPPGFAGRAPSTRDTVALPCYVDVRSRSVETVEREGRARARAPAATIGAETAATLLADEAFVSRVLSQTPPVKDVLTNAGDLAYMRWRYEHLGAYHAIRSGPGAHGDGFAIFKLRNNGAGRRVAEVCELVLTGESHAAGLRVLRQIAGLPGVELVRARFRSDGEAARCGFVREPGRRLLRVHSAGELTLDATRVESWGLSLGDLDLL